MESNLQIISGKFRGKKLTLPTGARPTQNRPRIALFNMLGDICGKPATVWDAFAGSGAFGIEFLSRNWAKHVIFTDNNANSIKTGKKNLAGFDRNEFTIKQADALAAIKEYAPIADIVFVDPPYDNAQLGEQFVAAFAAHAKPGAVVVWERETRNQEPGISNRDFEIIKHKRYGRAEFLIMEKK
jgi:16S rRNA (guanine966-N2)-methyltransferase